MFCILKASTKQHQTHNIALTAPAAKFVVSLGADGRVRGQGDLSSVLETDKTLQSSFSKELEALKRDEEQVEDVVDAKNAQQQTETKGRLVVEEEVAIGHLGWPACVYTYTIFHLEFVLNF